MVKLILTEEQALLLRDAISNRVCELKSDENGVVKKDWATRFSTVRVNAIRELTDIKNML